MISRRLVRIKAMQTYYAFLQAGGDVNIETIQKELDHNINQSYELFIHLHCLLVAVFDFAKNKIQFGLNKHIPTSEELSPNMKFVNNQIIEAFTNEPNIKKALINKSLNWSEHPEFIKSLYNEISKSAYYIDFMSDPEISLRQDFEIINKLISKSIITSSALEEILEDKSIYWNDDLEFLCSNIVQNIKRITERNISSFKLPRIFKCDEDENFGKVLIKYSALHSKKYDDIIVNSLKKWDLERIAFMDRVILHLALCEFIEMSNMPIKVTINEYLDISKFYSTEKSSIFINGILDKLHAELKEANKIRKTGRGMV